MKILLILDNEKSTLAPYIGDQVNYAMVADNISDFDDEDKQILCYGTKENYESGKGTLTYIDMLERDNIFEWTAKTI